MNLPRKRPSNIINYVSSGNILYFMKLIKYLTWFLVVSIFTALQWGFYWVVNICNSIVCVNTLINKNNSV
uniref:Uncharacterized protein n=1 Tax=Lotharella vacuolata TaxID=74820 RepID=A0A0H5BKY0_9EUKA|nr:hypothetical protein [Lotharella vacuolata]BAS01605.1 hypothetical protein [Lotharella vacuolata]